MVEKRVSPQDWAIFESIYEEYIAWDQEYSSEVLSGLQSSCSSTPELESIEPSDVRRTKNIRSRSAAKKLETAFEYETLAEDDFETVTVELNFQPVTNYETCTPGNNIQVGDDAVPMPFYPYSDDPTYNFDKYSDLYVMKFQWHNQRDPDCT